MKILFLHGWQSIPGGVKPTFLKDHGHTVINPALDDDDFDAAVTTAQAEYDQHQPDVVIGSSRGGAVAMNIDSHDTPLVLLCPAWKKWGTVTKLKPNSTILHSRKDDIVPFEHSEELMANSGMPAPTLMEVGNDHRLADPEPLAQMLEACETHYQMALMFSFYEGLALKGPGSKASTLKALSMLGELPASPRVVDFGCGAGAASIAIAKAIDCQITASDIHKPFLVEVNEHAQRAGLSERIETLLADMADPPIPNASVDLIWSEGAIYNIGFESGLKRWRRLLRPGGLIAVTELTWLTDHPPQPAVEFWEAEYPAISNVDANLKKMQSAGFEIIDHFTLPTEDWHNFYGPVEQRIASYREQHAENEVARAILDMQQTEVDLWKKHGDSYGYVFYLGRAV
ncbi:Demethylrebeccamycin-D-glucose O-methyltransferase [Bremerella volcania]|uniref:Demethylrebeccamycin-D-glucose O-methyltransferase n=1 Tax=Bremerella volcania TaxID=2527984 RepID=A0A518CC85_9BACT|nr:class I SAM-dependent methyltransferase [Bremerella volcania]QDU76835.1 Demethylrebeccamycin-D-glucose O-methyltransferase [Bremerella volcania]